MDRKITFIHFLILLILFSCKGGGGGTDSGGGTPEDSDSTSDSQKPADAEIPKDSGTFSDSEKPIGSEPDDGTITYLDNEIYQFEPNTSTTTSIGTFSSDETGEIPIPPSITFFFKSDGTGKLCDNLILKNELEEKKFTYEIKKGGEILVLSNEDGSTSTYNINPIFDNKIGLGGFEVNPGVTSIFKKRLLTPDENFESLFSNPCLFSTYKILDRYKTTETQTLNFPGNEFSKFTTVKSKVDFLFLWDNSSATKLISPETRYAMANTINFISENFDYRIIISPLLGEEIPNPFWESYIVSEDSSSVPPSILQRWTRPGYGAEAIFNFIPKGSLENGITRGYNLTKAGFESGFFRTGAHMIMIILSNGDDNSWMEESNYASGIAQSEYINNYAAKFKSLRDSKGSKTFRFLSVVAHSSCAGSKPGSTYKAMSAKLYSFQQQSPFPSAVPQGGTPDSFDFCNLPSFNQIFDGVNAAISPDNIPYTYNYWPITQNKNWIYDKNPEKVRVVVKDSLGNITQYVPYNSTSGWTFVDGWKDNFNIIECPIHPEINCNPPDAKGKVEVSGYFIKLNGSAKIKNPSFLDIETQTPPEFYGYVRLKYEPFVDPNKPITDSIRVRINGIAIPTNGFEYIGFRENQNVKILSNSDFTPNTANPLFQSGYFLKLSPTFVFGSGDTAEIDYWPPGSPLLPGDYTISQSPGLPYGPPSSNVNLSFDLTLKSFLSGEIDLTSFIEIVSKLPNYSYGPSTGSWSPGNFSQGQACWTWVGSGTPTSNPGAPTVANSGTWTWYSNYKCWLWSGSGTPPTPFKPSSGGTPGYEYPPGQQDPYSSDCYASGVSTGGGTLPYYRIPVTGHGNPGNLVWSSSALSSSDQKILTTDARFNLRIVAKAAPPKGAKDYKGNVCSYEGLAYTKIKLTVGLRSPNSNVYTGFYDLSDIPVGKCSNVLEFTDYQIPVTDGPIVLDIFNFTHDYYCKVYENSQYANNPYYCPYTPMYLNDCFSIEVQFSTDYTLDIPGTGGGASPVAASLEGVFKYFSVYPTSSGDIESGKKSLLKVIHMFKKDGTFKSCMFDDLKKQLDDEVSNKGYKYQIDNLVSLTITKDNGEKVPFGFKMLSDSQIELTGETPLGIGVAGIRGVTVVLEKSDTQGMNIDDFFNTSCQGLGQNITNAPSYGTGSGYETLDKFKSAVANNQWAQYPDFARFNFYKFNYSNPSSTEGCSKVGSGIFSFNYCLNKGTATPTWVTEEKRGVITNPLIPLAKIKDIVSRSVLWTYNIAADPSVPYASFDGKQWIIVIGTESFAFNPGYPLGANPTYYKNTNGNQEYSLTNYEYSYVP